MIRFAEKNDIDVILDLCQRHAIFEKSTYDISGKKEQLLLALFDERPKLFCLLAEVDQKVVGYATYTIQYSTWDAQDYLYMDCLYLMETSRGKGLGEHLIHKIKEEAIKYSCNLIQWQTPSFNERAIKFYNRIGAVSKSKERFFLSV